MRMLTILNTENSEVDRTSFSSRNLLVQNDPLRLIR